MNQETMASRLRYTRKAKGLTQQQVADRCGVSLPTYAHIERGTTISPQLLTIADISRCLGVTLDYLVFGVRTSALHGSRK
ncbi:helix-turn-helix transcriptional regulator [Ralstonia phage PQ43W]